MTFRNVTTLVALAAGLGTAAAVAAPGEPRPARMPLPQQVCPALPAPATKPTEALLSRFGVLREDREAQDALPADVVTFLRRRGLTGFDPSAARLLRTGANGGRAWILPVPDVRRASPPFFGCHLGGRFPAGPPTPGRAHPRTVPRPSRPPARPAPVPAVPSPATVPAPRVPPAPSTAPPAAQLPRPATVPRATTVPGARRAPREAPPALAVAPHLPPALPVLVAGPGTFVAPLDPVGDPQEGVIVVTKAGAPTGGGGALEDLLKGRAAASVEPCADGRADLIRISGLVPDGVDRVFLTADDGSAVEARPDRNGYVFTVPVRAGRPQQRYVVWTPQDGTPRVQPVVLVRAPKRIACALAASTADTILVGPVGRPLTAIPFGGRTRAGRRG